MKKEKIGNFSELLNLLEDSGLHDFFKGGSIEEQKKMEKI